MSEGISHTVVREYLMRHVRNATRYEIAADLHKDMSLLHVELNPGRKSPTVSRMPRGSSFGSSIR